MTPAKLGQIYFHHSSPAHQISFRVKNKSTPNGTYLSAKRLIQKRKAALGLR